MSERTADLPSYGRPPLVEVAMSVQFEAPKSLDVAHLGDFWSSVKGQVPHVKSAQPIAAAPDDLDTGGQWLPPSLSFGLTNEPDCRLQMTTEDGQWMWQVQSDRLVANWRKRTEDYPRYSAALRWFRDAWTRWCQYLDGEGSALPVPHRWEITYVNQIPSGAGGLWQSPSDWPTIFPGLWPRELPAASGLSLTGLRGQWVWEHDNPRARLHVHPKPGRSKNLDVLFLNLTAHGQVTRTGGEAGAGSAPSPTADEIMEQIEPGLDLGHRLIVKTFDAIGSPTAKEHWQRHDR